MPADEGRHARLLTLGKRRQNPIDRKTAQSDNRPSQLAPRRIGNLELRQAVFRKSGKVCGKNGFASSGEKVAASEVVRHGTMHSFAGIVMAGGRVRAGAWWRRRLLEQSFSPAGS